MILKNFKRIFGKVDKSKEEELRNEIDEYGGIEKKDLPAMIISAYVVVIPIAVLALLAMALVAWLFVR